MSAFDRRPPELWGDTSETRILLRPIAKAAHDAGSEAMRLAGGPLVFDSAELMLSSGAAPIGGWTAPLSAIREWAKASGATATARIEAQLARISRPREPILSLAFDRPCLMGVVNITPDSFSDGGDLLDPDAAAAWARQLVAAGADILDVGAESTRPGAAPTAPAEQLRRLLPVMARLGDLDVPLSIDTRSAEVMAEALAAGASLVNDVSGFRHDADALGVVAEAGVPVIVMHSRGGPTQMHHAPSYEDVAIEVLDELSARLDMLEGVGIAPNRIILDPGIGFSKSAAHNIALLSRLSLLHGLGRPLMIGLSRKSFIARFSRDEAERERLPGSLAGALWALQQGAQMLRVHDVAETRQAIALWRRLVGSAACG